MNTLKQYLEAQNIRQEDFAHRVGASQPVVSKLVHEKMNPGPELARRIHDVTGGDVPFWSWPSFSIFAPSDKSGGDSSKGSTS